MVPRLVHRRGSNSTTGCSREALKGRRILHCRSSWSDWGHLRSIVKDWQHLLLLLLLLLLLSQLQHVLFLLIGDRRL